MLMRDHSKAFCRLAAEHFACPDPVYEFGAFQVAGQVGYADLRPFFPARRYIGCDLRAGPGVDRIADIGAIDLPAASAGTVISLETLEHVLEIRRAFDEVFRVLRPGGLFLVTTVLNFPVHEYPEDYWRMTGQCLRRLMSPYAARVVGEQGTRAFPHTVMALGIKAPAPADAGDRARRFVRAYADWLDTAQSILPPVEKIRRALGRLSPSARERRDTADYYSARFTFEFESG